MVSAKVDTIKVNTPRDRSDKRFELSKGVERRVDIRSKAGFNIKNNISVIVSIFICEFFLAAELV